MIEPLTNPPADQPAFHVVVPSLPGFGFSSAPPSKGWTMADNARIFDKLMTGVLRYPTYMAAAGDYGGLICLFLGSDAYPACRLLDLFQTNLDDIDTSYKASVHPGYDKDCIAIGHFDRSGGYEPCQHAGQARHPPGDGVQVRRVADNSSGASFNQIVDIYDRTLRMKCSVSRRARRQLIQMHFHR